MNLVLIPLVVSLSLGTGLSSILDSPSRYITKPDPYDTTWWNDSYSLSADTTYNAVFKHYFDEDYYTFTATYLRSVAVIVNSPSQVAQINIYKNGTNNSNLVASYHSNVTVDYTHFSSNLVCVGPNETLYIEVLASTTASNYSIIVNTNPSLSGVSIIRRSNGQAPSSYYGGSPKSFINYYIDSSCDIDANPDGSYSIRDAYIAAIGEWNKVGNLSLNLVSNQSNADVTLYSSSFNYINSFAPNDEIWIGVTHSSISFYGNFSASACHVINDFSYCYQNNNYDTYRNYVSLCMHELGHSMGFDEIKENKVRNYMYKSGNEIINPFNTIGDGDVAAYIQIYGGL